MNKRASRVGFCQHVRLEWLERTANLVLAGNEKKAIIGTLREALLDKVSIGSTAERNNREKTITILCQTWVLARPEVEPLRKEGLDLLQKIPRRDHLPLYWGMTMAAYPFTSDVALHIGRLCKLQGSVSVSQVQRRMREHYGERETVSRAVRHVIRSFVDWGVLKGGKKKGVYHSKPATTMKDTRLTAWLVEAFLHTRTGDLMSLKDVFQSPCLFPFSFQNIQTRNILATSSGLDIVHLGWEHEVVTLKPHSA